MPEESLMVFEPFPMDLQKRVKSIKTGKYCSQVTYGKFHFPQLLLMLRNVSEDESSETFGCTKDFDFE